MSRHLMVVALALAVVAAAACDGDSETALEPGPDPVVPRDTVQLTIGDTLGIVDFAAGNTSEGGQGEPVAGVSCDNAEPDYHIHAHLSLYVDGQQVAIPEAIGVMDPQVVAGFVVAGSCFYWIHTHDATGIIHVEAPAEVELTLGQLFDVWGEPLSRDEVAGKEGPVTVLLDGEEYTGDPREIVLEAHGQIALEVGTPIVTPPVYLFPPTY